jgi:tetratricopeptide (TPR) repeat protein
LGKPDDEKKYNALSASLDKEMQAKIAALREEFKEAGDPETVDKVLRSVNVRLKSDPGNVGLIFLRATCHDTKRDYRAEVADCSELIAVRPEFPPLYSMRSKAYERLGDKKLAKKDFDQFLKMVGRLRKPGISEFGDETLRRSGNKQDAKSPPMVQQ